jgi:hypothetical protein
MPLPSAAPEFTGITHSGGMDGISAEFEQLSIIGDGGFQRLGERISGLRAFVVMRCSGDVGAALLGVVRR